MQDWHRLACSSEWHVPTSLRRASAGAFAANLEDAVADLQTADAGRNLCLQALAHTEDAPVSRPSILQHLSTGHSELVNLLQEGSIFHKGAKKGDYLGGRIEGI
jgi:hypothetical protein